MKRLIYTIAVVAASIIGMNAQKVDLLRCDDGTMLSGEYIPVPNGVKSFQTVENLPYFTIVDKDNNTRVYDINTFQLITTIRNAGEGVCNITRQGYLLTRSNMLTTNEYPVFYNWDNEQVWKVKEQVAITDRINNVVICYKSGSSIAGHMAAYDLADGHKLWQKSFSQRRHYALAHLFREDRDGEHYYMIADSIIRLNPITGEKLSHSFDAGVKASMKSRFTLVKHRFPSSFDWAKEAYFSNYVSTAYLTGTHSGAIMKGDSIFIADASHVYCFNRQLVPLWATSIPEGVSSKSSIKLAGDTLLMQNYGQGFNNGVHGSCGQPFMASYDRKTGRQLSFQIVKVEKKVVGGIIVPGKAYWQNDKGFSYSYAGDTLSTEIAWKPRTDRQSDPNHPDRIICDTVGVLRNGYLERIATNAQQIVVELYGKDVYLVHDDGTSEMIPAEDVFFHDGYNLYSTNADKERHYVIIDPDTWKVKYGFHTSLDLLYDKDGILFVNTRNGIGVIKLPH